jgi:hypothetical protein
MTRTVRSCCTFHARADRAAAERSALWLRRAGCLAALVIVVGWLLAVAFVIDGIR